MQVLNLNASAHMKRDSGEWRVRRVLAVAHTNRPKTHRNDLHPARDEGDNAGCYVVRPTSVEWEHLSGRAVQSVQQSNNRRAV